MKIIWDEADIQSGRTVCKPGTAERWMIGYIGGGDNCTLNSLCDGMVSGQYTKQSLAATLTTGGYWPAEFVDGLNAARPK